MEQTPSTSARRALDTINKPGHLDRIARTSGRPPRVLPHTRKYEVAFLTSDGDIQEMTRFAPALPAIEDAFGALGHGAILQTANGPMAVEDLLPGDQVRLADGTFDTLLWRGAMTLLPDDNIDGANTATLIRITADALGLDRPSPDLVLGPTARLCYKGNGVRQLSGSRLAFILARDFVDGNHFVELRPAAPVKVYQLGFDQHQQLSVNGIEVESLHPGTGFSLGLRGDTLTQYLSLFPHKRDLADFGPLQIPRLRLRDLDLSDLR